MTTTHALSLVIRSFKTSASSEDFVNETADLLTTAGIKPDPSEIWAAVFAAAMAGHQSLKNAIQPDGSFRVELEPPMLLPLDITFAVPLAIATRADLATHREFMARRRAEAVAVLSASS